MTSRVFFGHTFVRALSVVVAAFLAIKLPFTVFFYAVFILGHGHSFLAMWYQADAGKWHRRKIVLFLALFIFLVWLSGLVSLPWLAVAAGILFVLHFAFDEVHLLGGKPSYFALLEALPFIVLYSALLIDAMFGVSFSMYAVCLSGVVGVVYVVSAYRTHRAPDPVSYAFLAWTGVVLGAHVVALQYPDINPYLWFFGLIVIHYSIWYVAYWKRLAAKPEKQHAFLGRIALVHGLLLLAAFLWSVGLAPLFALLFATPLFYVWTFIHIGSSLRIADVKLFFRSA